MADELQAPTSDTGKRSYWPGISFLVAACAAKIIGMVASGSAVGSARSSSSFLGTASHLQMASNIQGITDILMFVLGIIGIIILISTARSRSSSKTSSV